MTELSFHEKGKGHPILLIHGFPMNAEIWSRFSNSLSSSFRVITVDLPGFGKSPLLTAPFSLTDVAELLLENLERKGITKILPIGHSLGGYITLAMVQKNPSQFPGFGLFHSTALPDSIEKKESRSKAIEFIRKNGARAFTSNFITPLFSDPTHPDVPFVRDMNMKTSEGALVAYIAAMRDRPDHTRLLETFQNPILLIAGAKDPVIPIASIHQQSALAQHPVMKILNDQAHMGLIEDVQTTSAIVYEFAAKCYN